MDTITGATAKVQASQGSKEACNPAIARLCRKAGSGACVPLPAVSARLGHADTNITARIYSHALPDDDQRAADTWEIVVKAPVH